MSSGRDQRELTGLGAYDIEAASERAGGLTEYFDRHQERLAEGIVAVECRTEKSGQLKFRIVKCGALDSNETWPSSLVAKCLPFEATNADDGSLVVDLDYFRTKYPASAASLAAMAEKVAVVIGCRLPDQTRISSRGVENFQRLIGQILTSESRSIVWSDTFFLCLTKAPVAEGISWRELLTTQWESQNPALLRRVRESVYSRPMRPEGSPKPELPPETELRDAIRLSTLAAESLPPAQSKAIASLVAASEWALLNGPAVDRLRTDGTQHSQSLTNPKCPPSVAEIKTWTPEAFFQWFDTAIMEIPRKQLVKPVKAWLKAQKGKHQFEDLPPEDALRAKRELAAAVNQVVETIGLAIVCGKDACEQNARLNAVQAGSSVRGQYSFVHPSTKPRHTVKHASTHSFPVLEFREV